MERPPRPPPRDQCFYRETPSRPTEVEGDSFTMALGQSKGGGEGWFEGSWGSSADPQKHTERGRNSGRPGGVLLPWPGCGLPHGQGPRGPGSIGEGSRCWCHGADRTTACPAASSAYGHERLLSVGLDLLLGPTAVTGLINRQPKQNDQWHRTATGVATTAELGPVRHRSWGQWRGSGGRIVSLRLQGREGKKCGAGPAAAMASHLLTPRSFHRGSRVLPPLPEATTGQRLVLRPRLRVAGVVAWAQPTRCFHEGPWAWSVCHGEAGTVLSSHPPCSGGGLGHPEPRGGILSGPQTRPPATWSLWVARYRSARPAGRAALSWVLWSATLLRATEVASRSHSHRHGVPVPPDGSFMRTGPVSAHSVPQGPTRPRPACGMDS